MSEPVVLIHFTSSPSDGLDMVLAAVMVFDSLIKYLVSDDKRA